MTDDGPVMLNDRYALHARIARGGMADVLLARDELLQRPVAVKMLFPEFAADPSFVERFRREAQSAAGLNHPGIVGVYDWGEQAGTYYIVMEYVEGKSLAEVLRSDGTMGHERAATTAREVAKALGAAHQRQVVHRDVKPGNVLLDDRGEVKVTDFGIARAVSGAPDDDLTRTGAVMGTATYLSPEQAQGFRVDQRSDLYSLGVVLFEMITGRPPFTGESPVSIAYKHVQNRPPLPRSLRADVPPGLEAVVLKLLAKKPDQRYADAQAVVDDLDRFLAGRSTTAEQELERARRAAAARSAGQAAGPAEAASGADDGGDVPVVRTSKPEPVVEPTRSMPVATPPAHGVPVLSGRPTGAQPPVDADQAGMRRETVPATHAGDVQRETGPGLSQGALGLVALLLAAAVGVLVWVGIGLLGGEDGPDQVVAPMPALVGTTLEEARAELLSAGFQLDDQHFVVETVPSADAPEGQVTQQQPAAGAELDPATALVRLTVSGGEEVAEIPAVEGTNADQAERALRNLFDNVAVESENSDEIEEGRAIRTEPPAGEEMAVGGTVTLFISNGTGTVEVPCVNGATPDDAQDTLEDEGFRVAIEQEPSDDVDEGSVIGTNPECGNSLDTGDEVIVRVSSGSADPVLPPVTQLDLDEALGRLATLGFEPVITRSETQDPNLDGIVLSQDPTAGTTLEEGSEVNLVVLSFEVPTTPPILTTTTLPPATTTLPPATTTTVPPTTTP